MLISSISPKSALTNNVVFRAFSKIKGLRYAGRNQIISSEFTTLAIDAFKYVDGIIYFHITHSNH